jgi:hypothetical protein
MPAWLTGTIVASLFGLAASAYLWGIRRRNDENAAGLQALAGMRWREFARLVLAAMQRRGYAQIAAGSEDAREQSASFLLGKDDRQVLLACKHGTSYRIGSATVDEIASDIRLRGAQSGILVTQGEIDRSGRDKAAKHDIEIVDGPRLWQEIRPLLDDGLRDGAVGAASARARRHIGIAWLGAVAIGAVVAVLLPAGRGTHAGAPVAAAVHAAAPAPAAQANEPPAPPVAPTEDQLDKERAEVARAISGIDGLVRGIWISRSTLAVDRSVGEDLALPLVCNELARHPDLAFTRVQLNPPPGSDERVHWRQCDAVQR